MMAFARWKAGSKSRTSSKPSKPRPRKAARGRRQGKTILHPCGHKEVHALKGPKWKKEKDAEWLKEQPCTICWGTQRAEEAESLCDVPNLPLLAGTERQVPWARTIRAGLIAKVKMDAWRMDMERNDKGLDPAAPRYLEIALPSILGQEDAKWWIDHREENLLDLLLDFDAQDAIAAIRSEEGAVVDCPF